MRDNNLLNAVTAKCIIAYRYGITLDHSLLKTKLLDGFGCAIKCVMV